MTPMWSRRPAHRHDLRNRRATRAATAKKRLLSLEPLERRELLSVAGLPSADVAAAPLDSGYGQGYVPPVTTVNNVVQVGQIVLQQDANGPYVNATLSNGSQAEVHFDGTGNPIVITAAGTLAVSTDTSAFNDPTKPPQSSGAYLLGSETSGSSSRAASFDDVEQRNADTCVFDSTLSALCRTNFYPETGIVLQKLESNGNLLFDVRFYKANSQGGYQTTWVPVEYNGTVTPSDLLSTDPNEYWPTLYQRAYLQLAQQQGFDYHSFTQASLALTGQPPSSFGLSATSSASPNTAGSATQPATPASSPAPAFGTAPTTPQAQAQAILDALNAGHPVMAGSESGPAVVLAGSGGLIANHSYTVLGIEIPASGATSGTYVTLRNPWGEDTSWTYFDTDSDGTLSLGEWVQYQYGLDGTNDGIIRIPWSTFSTYFQTVEINPVTGPGTNQPQQPTQPPVFNHPNQGPFTTHEGENLGPIDLTATVPAGQGVTYSLTAGSPGYVNPISGQYTWEPLSGQAGTYTVTVVAEETPFTTASMSFVVNVISGAPHIDSLTANPTSISAAGSDRLTLTANNVTAPIGRIDHVSFYRDANGDGIFEPNTDIWVGDASSTSGNAWSWSGYIGGLSAGSETFFAQADRISYTDNHFSNVAMTTVTVTPAPVVTPAAYPVSAEVAASATPTAKEYGAGLLRDGSGNFWVTWSVNSALYWRKFDASGNPLGAEQAFPVALGAAEAEKIVMMADDSFAVVWSVATGTYAQSNLYAQWFNADATPKGTAVTVSTDAWAQNSYIDAAADSSGNLLIAYNHGDYMSEDIYAASVSPAGTVTRAPWLVNSHTAGSQKYPTIALNASGSGVIAWTDGDQQQITARQVSNDGVNNGPELTVYKGSVIADWNMGSAVDASGDFILAWSGVYARLYGSDGTPKGPSFQVNTFRGGQQATPLVSMNDAGWSVVAWNSYGQDPNDTTGDTGVYAQVLDPKGSPVGPEFAVPTTFDYDEYVDGISLRNDNTLLVSWSHGGWNYPGNDRPYFREFTVNVAPVFASSPTFTLPENSPKGTVVGSVQTSDTDGDQTNYALLGNSPFGINPSTGQITVTDASALNYYQAASYTLTVQATDNGTPSLTTLGTVTVNLSPVTEPPAVQAPPLTIAEGSAAGTLVGLISASAHNPASRLVFSLAPGSPFAIDPNTGTISVADGSKVDYESTGPAHTISVTVLVGDGTSTAKLTVPISVTDVAPSVPTDANPAANVAFAGAPAGSPVGLTAAATDPAGGPVTYSLTNNAGGLFTIDPATGAVTVASGGLGVSAVGTYTLVATAADPSGLTSTANFTVAVLPAPPVIDNADPGYAQTGTWSVVTNSPGNSPGYGAGYAYAAPTSSNSSTSSATWTATGLAAGRYDVAVTWVAASNRASNAPYQIYDGTTLLATVLVNQQLAPSGASAGGSVFQSLGQFTLSGGGALNVVLGNNANGYVIADAIRVTPSATVPAILDGKGPGYAESGTWSQAAGVAGYNGDYHYAAPGTGSSTAAWQSTGLAPGAYDVQVTWGAGSNRATNAGYQIFDGSTLVATVTVNQKAAPSGPSFGGVAFQSLGVYNVSSGTLRVVLGNNANGYVVADAIRLAAPTAVPAVTDNSGANYAETGAWSQASGVAGYNADYRYAAPGTGSATAAWSTPSLAPGYYDVQVTWGAGTNRATNAPYRIYDGSTLLATVVVNQKAAPSGPSFGGVAFQSLGVYKVSGTGPLRVVLSDNANGYVIADAVRVAPTTAVPAVSDNSGTNYAETGTWSQASGVAGYNGDYRFAAPGNGSATATWSTPSLIPGYYDVQVTWGAGANRASNAPYRIYDGNTLLATVTVNQQLAPSGLSVGGVAFQSLGVYNVSSGSLRVVLANSANGYVIADAIRVAPATAVPAVTDNAGPNYAESETWSKASGVLGYNGDYHYAAPGTGSATATWSTPSLAPGVYDVQVTWGAGTNRATNAPYQVYDGNTLLGTVLVNQQLAPTGVAAGGVTFQSLGLFNIKTGVLRVVLTNNANGYVIADAVRIAPPSAPVVTDNHDAGYAQTGTWTNTSTIAGYSAGFGGDYNYAAPTSSASANATATWTRAGLTAGNYDVQVTWVMGTNRATNAPYRIYDGNTLLATVLVNQQAAPSGVSAGGVVFQSLGVFKISSGTLRVVLGNNANGYVVADAMRLAPPTALPALTDDGGAGYAAAGTWSLASGFGGYGNTYHYAAPGTGNATASWTTTGLAPRSYHVAVTWGAGTNRATNAPYQIYDGTKLLATVTVNQQLAPSGQAYGGTTFQSLGFFNITSGTLRVVLSNNANGYIVADALLVTG